MISINDAVNKVEKIVEEKAIKVCDYKSKYYLVVSKGETPFYIVDKSNGDSRFLNPLEDFPELINSIENRVLKEL